MIHLRALVRLVLLALPLAAVAGCGGSAASDASAAVAPISVSAQAARIDSIRDSLLVPGNVVPVPAADWTVYASETGRIAELPKTEGDAVKAGDVLVRFDVESFTADIASSQLAVSDATARLSTAKSELTRMTSLYERGLTSRNDFEATKAAVAAADSTLAGALTLQKAAQAIAARAVVTARFDGVIAKRWHNEGDFVNAAVNDAVLRVIDPTRVQVAVQVTAGQLARIAIGQTATISTGGAESLEPATVVTQPMTVDPSTSTQEVRLSFAAATTLTAGMLVQVDLTLDQRANVVVVPAAAIVRRDSDVFVMIAGADGRAHRRDVRLGLVTKTLVEIVAGVTAGDRVIVNGLSDVTDGAPISVDR